MLVFFDISCMQCDVALRAAQHENAAYACVAGAIRQLALHDIQTYIETNSHNTLVRYSVVPTVYGPAR